MLVKFDRLGRVLERCSVLLLTLIFMFGGLPAKAERVENPCAVAIGDPKILEDDLGLKPKPRSLRFQTEWDRFVSELTESGNPIETQRERMRRFGKTIDTLPDNTQKTALRDNLEALRVIDYADAAPILLKAFTKRDESILLDAKIWTLYDKSDGPKRDAFGPLKEAKKYVETLGYKNPYADYALEQLLEVQRLAMNGSRLKGEQLGIVRRHWVGADEVLSHKQYLNVLKNDYLVFREKKDLRQNSVKVSERIYTGWIGYPEPLFVKEAALAHLRGSHADLLSRIAAFQKQYGRNWDLAARDSQYGSLTEDLLVALSEERIQRFNDFRVKLGPPTTYEKINAYVNEVALYYRDMISIHLLPDGNGRSTRQFALYEPLRRMGLPRPRLTDPNFDYLLAPTQWVEQVKKAILSNHFTYDDITRRIEHGESIVNSAELLFPDLPRNIHLWSRKHGVRTRERSGQLSDIDPKQFAAFLATSLQLDPDLIKTLKTQPVETMASLREAFKDLTRKQHLFYTDKQGKRKEIGLVLVDHDFIDSFGVAAFGDVASWRKKMDDGYREELVFRGLAGLKASGNKITDDNLLEYFKDFVPHFFSMRIGARLDGSASRETVIKEARKDFATYNKELVTETMWELALDHVLAKGRYNSSYGISTSTKYSQGVRFAMGSLVVGNTSEDFKLPEYQEQVEDRIVVGTARADFFVDTNRLKLFSQEFSSQFPRQAEQIGIGAVDPDAILIVQRLDKKGKAMKTWVRNPHKPDEIWVIDGDYAQKEQPWTEWSEPTLPHRVEPLAP